GRLLLPLRADSCGAGLAADFAQWTWDPGGGRRGSIPNGGHDEGAGLYGSVPHVSDLRDDQPLGRTHLRIPDASARPEGRPGAAPDGARRRISTSGEGGRLSATKRWHAFFAAIAFGVPRLAYLRTITPTVPFWDSGEFIATSWLLGLPHPPGNPVYTLLGRMFSLVPIETVAWRVNFMSSFASALTCLFTFLFTVRALRRTVAGGRGTMVEWFGCELGGLVATFFLAFASSFWDSAIE